MLIIPPWNSIIYLVYQCAWSSLNLTQYLLKSKQSYYAVRGSQKCALCWLNAYLHIMHFLIMSFLEAVFFPREYLEAIFSAFNRQKKNQ